MRNILLLFIVVIMTTLISCSSDDEPVVTPEPTPIVTPEPVEPTPVVTPKPDLFLRSCMKSNGKPQSFGYKCEGGYFINWTTTNRIVIAEPSIVKQLAFNCAEVQEKWSDGNKGKSEGKEFTKRLVEKCNSNPAAFYCENLVHKGYSDWYLPSFGELDFLLDKNIFRPLGYATGYYWSSAKGCYGKPYRRHSSGGLNTDGNVSDLNNVICVRHSSVYK